MPHSRCSPSNVAAALLLPPTESGTCRDVLGSMIRAPWRTDSRLLERVAAFQTRFCSAGTPVSPEHSRSQGWGGPQFQDVVQIDRLEDGPDLVIAVRPLAEHRQGKIDLGE